MDNATIDAQVEQIMTGPCPKGGQHHLVLITVYAGDEKGVGVECFKKCGLRVVLTEEAVIRLILREATERGAEALG